MKPLLGLVSVLLWAAAAAADDDPVRAWGASHLEPALGRLPPSIREADAPRGELRVEPPGEDGKRARLVERLVDPAPPPGRPAWIDVEYTIDPGLEERVEGVLRRAGVTLGQTIVLDPDTGAVLAYVTTDPVAFPATRPYPTASLMKIVTAAALLRHAPEAADRRCRYVGSPYQVLRDRLAPPTVGGRYDSFARAMANSNNQCFARFAAFDVGADALLAEVRNAGLLEPPAAGHPPGRVEPATDPLAVGELGSGLSGSFVTPLGAARLVGLLVRGELVRPHWVAEARDAHGHAVQRPDYEAPRSVWSIELAERLRRLLVDVTEHGTARRAFQGPSGGRLDQIRVAGKTGTLSGTDPPGLYQWFAGVAPADAPTMVVVSVAVDSPASAAELAAETLHEIFCGESECEPSRSETLRVHVGLPPAGGVGAGPGLAIEEIPPGELAELVEAADLDRPPRPLEVEALELPGALRRRPAHGTIVLLLELDPEGKVLDARIDSSDLPRFDQFVLHAVRDWRFTPPTRDGRPVRARARLPIPIQIN